MVAYDVVIYGGGHAGAVLAKSLSHQYKVALVDPNDFFEVSSSIVRSLVESEFASNATFLYKDALPQTELIQGHLVELQPNGDGKVLVDGNEIVLVHARVVVLATGARYKTQATRSTERNTRRSRLEFYAKLAERIEQKSNIVIVGGGPIGVEFAAEVVDKYPANKSITIVNAGSRVVQNTTPAASQVAANFLTKHGVNILNNTRVELDPRKSNSLFESGEVQLSNGDVLPYDVLLHASGGQAISEYMTPHWSSSINELGEIKVSPEFLVVNDHSISNVFAFGDVAELEEPKLAWLVGEQVSVLQHNVQAKLQESPHLKKYGRHNNDPRIGLTLGKNAGVLQIPYVGTVTWGWFVRKAKSQTMMVPKFRKAFGLA